MFNFFRKHRWILIVAMTITCISFVYWGFNPANKGDSTNGGYGTIYGKPVTVTDMQRARGEFFIYYWLRSNGQWPDKAGVMSSDELERQTYIRLLIAKKASQLNIHVSEEAVATAASEFLRSIGRNGQPVKMQDFLERVLAPERLGIQDLQDFLRSELVVQQLIQTYGLPGALVTPQEAGMIYDHENQEVSAQAVFFAASNYLAQVSLNPAAIAQFYTNRMATYREPNRVQISYVYYNITNYLAQSKAEWEKTNFNEYVDSVYAQYGATEFADAKTPEEAKAKIRELVIRNRALADARQDANAFASELFAIEPIKAGNLADLAQKKHLTVRTTAPFDDNTGPSEFEASSAFIKAAFQLNDESPYAGPLITENGLYVVALANQLPSAIPPLENIKARVTQDYREYAAVLLAQQAGTNYYHNLTTQMAAGKTFAQAAVAAGQTPLVLPPFSLSTTYMPELGGHAGIGQIKQAAFTTTTGRVSPFEPTADGGFILFVQETLPIDATKKTADLPQFTSQIRRGRENEAFNMWLAGEINRQLQAIPVFQKEAAGMAK